MNFPVSPLRVRLGIVAIFVGLAGGAILHGQIGRSIDAPGPKVVDGKPASPALAEALERLRAFPNDAYLQYVVLQFARREKKLDTVSAEVEELLGRANGGRLNERVNNVDLFSLFTGSLAVQESLQLDSMRGETPRRARPVRPDEKPVDPAERRKQRVAVADLKGPTIKSHPWETLLGAVKVDPGPLARCVPEDFYFIEFRSLTKLLDAMELSDLWGTHLFNQAAREARTQQVGERLKGQLALETNALLRPVYDLVVSDVAIVGSDLFVGEGSDVTMIFRAKSPTALRSRMDSFLDRAAKAHPDATRTTKKYGSVEYVHLATPDRSVCVYSAYPAADLHVRSNSQVALERVLAAIQGKDADGNAVRRLGDATEFQYVRTLMPRGDKEEDGFVYLSDPFIRRLMGPTVKLTERRRMLCYNHLRMIGHAALLYRTEQGKPANSLDELVKAECLPGSFNAGTFTCADGGKYALSPDGNFGTCSHHGHAQCMTPCCEIPLKQANGEEADEYKAFLDDYNQYWRMYFDPIALRLQITPERYRLETIILPLIDNSIYTALSHTLGGTPEALDTLPVPKRNIFSAVVKLNKLELLKEAGLVEEMAGDAEKRQAVRDERANANNLRQIGGGFKDGYTSTHDDFTARASITDKNGRSQLSWRVDILPYLGEWELYNQFKRDEPWDSDHNKKLIAKMPAAFRAPGSKAGEGKTTYLYPVGPGAVFEKADSRVNLRRSFTDGTSNTILLVDAADDQAVTWTKPDDLKYDAKDPLKGLAVRNGKDVLVCFADGAVHALSKTATKASLVAAFTPDGGDTAGFSNQEDRVLNEEQASILGFLDLPPELIEQLRVKEFLTKGIGNQLGLHVYDSVPTFDLNLPQFLGLALGTMNDRRGGLGQTELLIGVLITALNAPVYVSIPVQDAKVVDAFLDRLDPVLAEVFRSKTRGALDFYKAPLKPDRTMRVGSLQFGPLKWRMFWARIGDGLYIATKSFILEDLVALEAERAKGGAKAADEGPKAHGMVRVRPANWDRVLADYLLGWAESNRQACLNNLGPLASVGRAIVAGAGKERTEEQLGRSAHQEADRLYGAHFYCPEGGRYLLSTDGKTCRCSLHGSLLEPKQEVEPAEKGSTSPLRGLSGMTASLTFLKDGLHAVVVIDRKP